MDITFPLFAYISGGCSGAFVALMCSSARGRKPYILGVLLFLAIVSAIVEAVRSIGFGELLLGSPNTPLSYSILLFFVFALFGGLVAHALWRDYDEESVFG